ncbi:MAG: AAA family ATPase [Candidatus Riflebacteria bacterium]|nr:AAA family ATPase [Candidatus Riflebacteria bacterium]
MSKSQHDSAISNLRMALVSGYPVIAIDSWEEEKVDSSIVSLSRAVFQCDKQIIRWDSHIGLTVDDQVIGPPGDPEAALDKIYSLTDEGFYLFKDMGPFLANTEVKRRIKNIASSFRGTRRFLFLSGSEITIPSELRKDIYLILFGLPDSIEIKEIVEKHFANLAKRTCENKLTPEDMSNIITALQGFTGNEINSVLNKILWNRAKIDSSVLNLFYSEKEQLTRKEGILEFVKTDFTINDVGGLAGLKNWLTKRKQLFSPEAAAIGLTPPKGLLMMGISGCGKSLSVKAISSLWNLPLFRLDMNQVYSGLYGTPESTFQRAIQTIEAVAPAILWIDEIEGGISSSTAKDGSTGSHIFSAFLTWMQEKKADVFVAATANRIDLLPAEIIRKGRFDQVFFLDLPNDQEREEILKVHLSKRNNDPADFDLTMLSVATEFWNGAEIEHAIEAAMIEAFNFKRKMNLDDLYSIIRITVPLSRTMAEQIKFIKGWASERALSASKIMEKN